MGGVLDLIVSVPDRCPLFSLNARVDVNFVKVKYIFKWLLLPNSPTEVFHFISLCTKFTKTRHTEFQ